MKPPRRITPTVIRRGLNLIKAAAEHASAGFPQASDEQVAERFAICQVCELFEPKGEGRGICTHPSCGCNMKRVGLEGLNKLRWKEQACPIGKWPAVEPAPPTA